MEAAPGRFLMSFRLTQLFQVFHFEPLEEDLSLLAHRRLLHAKLKLVGSPSAVRAESEMRSIILKSGWWLIGDEVRRAVAKHLKGSDVIGPHRSRK
jgi:hypothetical protein